MSFSNLSLEPRFITLKEKTINKVMPKITIVEFLTFLLDNSLTNKIEKRRIPIIKLIYIIVKVSAGKSTIIVCSKAKSSLLGSNNENCIIISAIKNIPRIAVIYIIRKIINTLGILFMTGNNISNACPTSLNGKIKIL